IVGKITGTSPVGLVKTGASTLVLSNTANDYTGGTAVVGGVLQIDADSELGNVAGGVLLAGGTLATTKTFTLVATGTVTLDSGSGAFDVAAATTLTVAGQITENVPSMLTKLGLGTLVLTNTGNNYSGGTRITAGTLRVNDDRELGALAGGITL